MSVKSLVRGYENGEVIIINFYILYLLYNNYKVEVFIIIIGFNF